ncbi:unnamed protein product, partial [Hapterophycus canaliculatus]
PARPNDVVYNSLSLNVAVGKTLALVGPSGGGKSTMTKLLLRFYDPTAGAVRLDGTDVRFLNVAWYRQQIGYVGQEPVLFAGTIALNIANGKQGATEAESEHDYVLVLLHCFCVRDLLCRTPDRHLRRTRGSR